MNYEKIMNKKRSRKGNKKEKENNEQKSLVLNSLIKNEHLNK